MRHVARLGWAWLICLALSGLAWAQGQTPQMPGEAAPAKSWVPSYFVTGLAIAAALFLICRPSSRRKDFRHEAS